MRFKIARFKSVAGPITNWKLGKWVIDTTRWEEWDMEVFARPSRVLRRSVILLDNDVNRVGMENCRICQTSKHRLQPMSPECLRC